MPDENISSRLILRVKRKRSSAVENNENATDTENRSSARRVLSTKRENPFSADTCNKVKEVCESMGQCSEPRERKMQQKLAPFLEQLDLYNSISSCAGDQSAHLQESTGQSDAVKCHSTMRTLKGNISFPKGSSSGAEEPGVCESTLPLDWCLKQRVRFMSSLPIKACLNIKSPNHARGLSEYVRCGPENADDDCIVKYLGHWQHPHIPGIPAYPLAGAGTAQFGIKNKPGASTLLDTNAEFQEALLYSWRESFQSVFLLLKTGFCPYFYFIGHLFWAVFRATGIADNKLNAILTPTTKGFRDMLTAEGILFTMPVTQCNKSKQSDECGRVDVGEERNTESIYDNEHEEFLNSIGLSKDRHFPAMSEQQRLNKKASLRKVDHRPESTISVTGTDVHSLFNFLLNSDFLCAPSGPMAGVPPTLLSAVAFDGASLRIAKYSYGPLKHQHLGETREAYYVDITGPLLPSQLFCLTKMLHCSQQGKISLYVRPYVHCAAFNVDGALAFLTPEEVSEQRISNFGLSSDVHKYLCSTDCRSLPDNVPISFDRM